MAKTQTIPDNLSLYGNVELLAAGEDNTGPRKFKIEAYSGGTMDHGDFPVPVVVNVRGITKASDSLPILGDHERSLSAAVGHTETVAFEDNIVTEGVFSGSNEVTTEIVSKLDSGMTLQASIGIRYRSGDLRVIEKEETLQANGRTFTGPLVYIEKAKMFEISIVPVGADQKTSVELAAHLFDNPGAEMPAKDKAAPDAASDEKELKADGKSAAVDTEKELLAYRKDRAADVTRCDSIETLCASFGNPKIKVEDKEVCLKAHAIASGWDVETTELYAHRSSAPKAPAVQIKDNVIGNEVLECALARQVCSSEFVEKQYDQKTLEASDRRDLRGIGPQQLMHEALYSSGASVRPGLSGDALIEAYQTHVLRASSGGSTVSLPGILGNVANKRSEQAFAQQNVTYPSVTSTKSVKDFKTVTGYRLNELSTYEKVGKDGELKHGKLGEESYTNSVDTYGGMLALNRQDIINDDLGKFDEIPAQIGAEAAMVIEQKVYEALKGATTSFFAVGKGNLAASNAFSYAGLTAAEQKFMEQTRPNGRPLMLSPEILLVPPGLSHEAARLMGSANLNETTTADTPVGDRNLHAGKYRVVTSPFLSNTTILPHESADLTSWYLMASPGTESAIEVAFLNGVQTPTIQSQDASFNVLGTQWRFFFDFGVALREYRAAVKNTA